MKSATRISAPRPVPVTLPTARAIPMSFRWIGLLGLLAGMCLSAPAAAAPEVTGARIVPPKDPLQIGTPFVLVLDVRVPAGLSWRLPPVPLPIGAFTLRRIRIQPSGTAGQVRLEAELQAFQIGSLPLPVLPVQWQLAGRPPQPLAYTPGNVEVGKLLRGRGPFAFQPPRGGLAPPAASRAPWLYAGLALLLAGAAAGWHWRRRVRRRRSVPATTPRTVDLDHFLHRLDQVLDSSSHGGTIQWRAGRLVEVFRDFLSWRFRRDFHPLTTSEIRSALETIHSLGETTATAVVQTLQAVDELRFAPPAGGHLPALAATLRGAMMEIGSRKEETADAVVGPAVT
jgi:hypothetical protein